MKNRYDSNLIKENIYKFRQLRGFSQMSLSKKTNGKVSASHIGKIEKGEKMPSNIERLQIIANALDITVDDLLLGCLDANSNFIASNVPEDIYLKLKMLGESELINLMKITDDFVQIVDEMNKE